MRKLIGHIAWVIILSACTKDKVLLPCPEPVPPDHIPTIKFVFVNRNGFRNDSVGNGSTDTVLSGVCLESKYYNPQTNMSQIVSTCYNRNFQSNYFPLSDSILHREYPVYIGSSYAFEVELGWKDQNLFSTKGFRFATQNWPNGEYISVSKDTIIKFVWPDDTLPGSRFHKTYQFP